MQSASASRPACYRLRTTTPLSNDATCARFPFTSPSPTSTDEPFASFINNLPKYVVSTTLERVDWTNAHLIKGNLAEEVGKLKQQPGKNIGIQGSSTLVRSLIAADLLDELTLLVHPVVVNHGKRLFDGQGDLKRFALVESRTTPTGVALLRYEPRRS